MSWSVPDVVREPSAQEKHLILQCGNKELVATLHPRAVARIQITLTYLKLYIRNSLQIIAE